MRHVNSLVAIAITAAVASAPAMAQSGSMMPGMTMPMPKAAPTKKTPPRKPAATAAKKPVRKATATKAPSRPVTGKPAAPAKPGAVMDPGMDMSGGDMQGMDHSKMDMSGGDMQGMDHSKMDMPGMSPDRDLPANAPPRTPIPAPTDADRAAAFMPTGGHPVHDKSIESMWLVDRLEVTDESRTGAWDALAWIGGDLNRVWLRSEGETAEGRVSDGDLEVLYGRSVATWWDVVAGVRQDFGEGPSRTYAAFGVQGLAPYKFEVQATGYVGNGGRTAARLDAEYDTLFTNRLILQWRGEANLFGRSDPARGIGSGLSTLEAGARLRYEITRRFAPYIGVEVERAFGNTARLRRADGSDPTDTRVVAGIRFWF